jgi:uncharacterized damage-inducible protein DinB
MFRSAADFTAFWTQEAGHTLKLFAAIPDVALAQAVNEQHRDLRRLAWHITESVAEMPPHMGLAIAGFPGEPCQTAPPATMQEIMGIYTAVSDSLLAEIAKLNNMAFAALYDFYGMKWTGAFALQVLVTHQVHHRGQMTVLMRQAGLAVPGTIGPAKEDWAAMGAPEPAV